MLDEYEMILEFCWDLIEVLSLEREILRMLLEWVWDKKGLDV